MSLLQTKKRSLPIIIALLIIVLQGFHTQVQAESTDKRDTSQILFSEGIKAFNARDYQTALEKFNNSLTIYRELGDRQSEADLLTWISAGSFRIKEDLSDAINYLKEAQKIYNMLNSGPGENAYVNDIDKQMKIFKYSDEIVRHLETGDFQLALKKSNVTLQLIRDMGDKQREARGLIGIGIIQTFLSNYSDAEHNFNNSLTIYREIGDRQSEADLLTWMSMVKYDTGKYVDALNYLKKSQEIYTELSSSPGEMFLTVVYGIDIYEIIKFLELFVEANGLMNAKDYKAALKKYNYVLQLVKDKGGREYYESFEANILDRIGIVQFMLENYSDAEHYCREVLNFIRKPGIKALEQRPLLLRMAIIYLEKDEVSKSLEYCNEAFSISENLNDKVGIRYSLVAFGMVYYELKDYSKALDYYKRALVIAQEIGDRKEEAQIVKSLGWIHLDMDDHNKSLEYCNEALRIFEDLKDKDSMIMTLNDIALIYYELKDYSKALAYYKRALVISTEIEDKKSVERVTTSLGITYENLGWFYKGLSYKKSLEYFKQALNTIQETGNHSEKGRILYAIGQLLSNMGDYEDSLKALNKAMQIYKEHNSMIDQGEALVEIGKVNSKLGNYLEAIDNLQEALKIFEGIRDNDAIKKVALNTLGNVYRLLGDDETAKEYDIDNKGTEKPDKKDKRNRLSFLRKQAYYFIEENKEDEVSNAIDRILDLSKEADDKVFERSCLDQIGLIYIFLREYTKALDYYKQALEVSRKHNDKAGELIALLDIAKTYDYPFLSDYPNALEYYEQALVIAKEIGDKPSERECLFAIGEKFFQQKKYEKAEEFLKNALFVSQETGAPEEIWDSQNKLGHLAYNTGQLQKAKSYYGEAINTIESIRENISVEEYRTSFIEDKLLVYSFMIFTLLELEEFEEAFNYVERAKSRTLLDILGNKVKLKRGKDKELSQEEMNLQKKINELLEKIRKEQSQPKEKQRAILTKWNKELENARKEYTDLLIKIKQDNPEVYSLVSVNPLTLKEIQELIEPDTTILEYYFDGSNDDNILSLYCWVINKNEYRLLVRNVPELSSKITAFREKIANFQSDYEIEAEELYDLLIRPAKPYIKTKRICIVPHSVLHYLPFQALINTDETKNESGDHPRFLIEEYDIFYTPSASVLKFVLEKRKKGSGNVLAFGNPEFADKDRNLPHAEEEVKGIKDIYPETALYLNENATEEKAKSLSGDYDIIHFASHGELNPQSPLFSCIKMAKGKDEDGRLEVHEIFNLNLENAFLVTLSACETGLSKLTNGDELIGLTRGFIYAGTPSIVASLWNVNDKSTSDLMSLFYKNLKTHSKVEALRMAQLEMINGEVGRGIVRGVGGITTSKEGEDKPESSTTVNGSHPYFWAPFVLLGDWK